MENENLLIIEIIKNPFNPNAYKKLAMYYESIKRPNESLSLLSLSKLYHEKNNNSNIN